MIRGPYPVNRRVLLLLPLIAFLGVFFLYPLADMLRQSFTQFISPEVRGMDNYQWFFGTKVNVTVLGRTFQTALLVTLICLVLAYPYAYLMTIAGPRTRILMLGAVLVPFWTSLMVRNFAWIVLLQDGGPINDLLSVVGLGDVKLLGSGKAVLIGMAQVLLPFMVLPLYAVLRGIDRRLLLAAQGLGASPRAAFVRVYLPLSLPGVFAGSLLVFVLALGFFVTPALLGSPNNALLSQLIVTQVNQLLAFGRGGSMAAVLMAITFVLLGLAALAGRRARAYETSEPG